VSRAFRNCFTRRIEEVLVHTGQHHDDNMSEVFIDEMRIPQSAVNLEISGGSHGTMTGRMLEAIEKVLQADAPEPACVVAGDLRTDWRECPGIGGRHG
jgi:UDP-GlcNAc3NAcA epimerase